MPQDIKQWCRECSRCQQSKVVRHTKGELQSFNLPATNWFEVVHIDIVGPLPLTLIVTGRHSTSIYLVIFINRATRWVEAHPITSINAEVVAEAYLCQWISHFGVHLYLVTDRERQFEAELFDKLSPPTYNSLPAAIKRHHRACTCHDQNSSEG